MLDTIIQLLRRILPAAIPLRPQDCPLGNRRQGTAPPYTAMIRHNPVPGAVDVQDRQRLPSGRAGGVGRRVRVEGALDSGQRGKLASVTGRAGQRADEPAALGEARRVDAGGVDAVGGLELVDQVCGEDLVADAWLGVRCPLPACL